MTSTFIGLVAGIVIAAYLTTHYSEAINRHLGELSLLRDDSAALEAPTSDLLAAVMPQPAPVVPEPAPVVPEPAPVVPQAAEQASDVAVTAPTDATLASLSAPPQSEQQSAQAAGDELEQRWADFAANADTLAPVGQFRWRQCFTRAAAAYGVSEPLLLAIASGESGFDPAARSDKDAIGVMQIRWPDTSRHLGILREADLYDPCTNIDAGARYLAELTERFANNLHRVVAAYNYGPGGIAGEDLPEGARWYSQYIYQHLQRVLDRPHVPSSELVPPRATEGSGYQVLITFNQAYRARDYKAYLESQIPDLELAYRSEVSGQHQIVLLYSDDTERRNALDAIAGTGLLASRLKSNRSISL